MVELGEILYVKPGTVSLRYDRIPVVVFETRENFCRVRFVIPGEGYHGEWAFSLDDMRHYLER